MKEIKLSQQGKHKNKHVALVDDEDYEYLNQWRWSRGKVGSIHYAMRTCNQKKGERPIRIMMHRLIMNTPKEMNVDHIDHNGLNNQKSNLRNCTQKENTRNTSPRKGSRSKYLGVSVQRKKTRNGIAIYYRVKVKQRINIGNFKTEIEAALAYNEAAKYYYGEFANLNVIQE